MSSLHEKFETFLIENQQRYTEQKKKLFQLSLRKEIISKSMNSFQRNMLRVTV